MTLQVRVKAKFPAQVSATDGITVSKSGGAWTFGLGLGSLDVTASLSATFSASTYLPLFYSGTVSYGIISIKDLQTTINAGLDATLVAMANLAPAANEFVYFTAADTATTATVSAAARGLLDDSTVANMRTTLGLAIGTDVQAYDPGLADISGITASTNTIIVGDGANWVGQSGSVARTSLGLVIGTDVQAYDAGLNDIAGITASTSTIIVGDGVNWGGQSGSVARASLGLAIGTDVQAYHQYLASLVGLSLAAGDIIYANSTNTFAVLNIGSTGQILQASGTSIVWGSGLSATVRELLTSSRTYYVRTDGSDSNNGLTNTSTGSFLSLTKAISVVSTLDLSVYAVTVQLGTTGTYSGFTASAQFIGGPGSSIIINGNTSSPSSYILSSDIVAENNALLQVQGVDFSSSGYGLLAQDGGAIAVPGAVVFGTCSTAHIFSQRNGNIKVTSNYVIDGGAPFHVSAQSHGLATIAGLTVTLTATPTFTTQFANASNLGLIKIDSNTYIGTATGTRYISQQNSVINTGGSGAGYLPGSTTGSTATGGIYV